MYIAAYPVRILTMSVLSLRTHIKDYELTCKLQPAKVNADKHDFAAMAKQRLSDIS